MTPEPSAFLTRRSLMLGSVLALPLVPRAFAASMPGSIPPARRLAFEVYRDASPIGTHTLGFAVAGDHLTVRIDIKIAVDVGPITVFRYTMAGEETWQGDRFVALTTATNDNGEHHHVEIQRDGDALVIQSSGLPNRTVPSPYAPLTHWSSAVLSGPLLSPQDGQPMQVSVKPVGAQAVALADGRSVRATGFDITTHTPTQDWYDPDGVWVGLRAKIRDGSMMEYRRL
jgi:hypothetical protein